MQTKDSVSAQKSRKIAGLNDRESWAIKRCFHMGDETEMKLASLVMHIGAKYFLKSHFHFLWNTFKIVNPDPSYRISRLCIIQGCRFGPFRPNLGSLSFF